MRSLHARVLHCAVVNSEGPTYWPLMSNTANVGARSGRHSGESVSERSLGHLSLDSYLIGMNSAHIDLLPKTSPMHLSSAACYHGAGFHTPVGNLA